MRLRFELRVVCRDGKTAGNLESVLKPDNKGIPKAQRFSMARRSNTLDFVIDSDRLTSALTSVQSILSDVRLFQEVSLLTDA
ncbi:MAG: hypothetical protein OK422_00810 [Thaumarchaeota archaeon]|nr:hypothetical protein [Nitrososphaerota archaeon]